VKKSAHSHTTFSGNEAVADRLLTLRSLLDDLAEQGLVSSDDVNRLTSQQRGKADAELHPLNYIANQQLDNKKLAGQKLNISQLVDWLSEQAAQATYHIDPIKIDVRTVTQVMSFAFAKRHKILAVDVSDEQVVIASAQPFFSAWEADLVHTLQKRIVRVVANPADIKRYTVEFYSLANSVSGAAGGNTGNAISNFEQLLELGKLKDPDANDQHIVNIVDWLLQYAFDQRASDIHIEPRRESGNIRFRIDGVLTQIYELPPAVINAVTSRLKILARMDLAEKRKPQDGRIKTVSHEGNEVELRLATMPTAFGEKLVIRIFDPDVLLRSFEDLGLVGNDYQRWNDMAKNPNGILLVTGPTGSGKTTTLYSTLKQLATPDVNVCTIEDPIEMVEPAFNQMQVQQKIDLDFANGVRALMRQDPDIIMIGEIRDKETAEMAVQAALTGHLVISTVHTNDAPSALSRLLELGIPAYLIRATLLGVMAQRLVRTLCNECKQPTQVEDDVWDELTRPWSVGKPTEVYRAEGCLACRNSGFYGRQGIYEILPVSRSLKQNIVDDFQLETLREQGMREGMRTLRLSGAQKIAAGLTTPEEVLRVTPAVDK
jgi:general secretion pathway protein E